MASHNQDDIPVSACSDHLRAAAWNSGEKLLLIGVEGRQAIDLTDLYRKSGRPVPLVQALPTAAAALERLAEEAFDCILVTSSISTLTQGGVDAQAFCSAVRATGSTDAVLVLASTASDSLWRATCEAEAELYVGPSPWCSPTLLLLIDRACQRRTVARDNQRRHWADGQRVDRDRADCTDLLRQQWQLLIDASVGRSGNVEAILAAELAPIYREILRTYVTGTVSLTREIKKLVQTFSLAHLTPRQVLQLHLEQVESLIQGIGQRSARHIVDRANVLCLELMVVLCECFEEQNARTWWAWRRQPVADVGLSLERRAA